MTVDGVELLMDVDVPEGEGPISSVAAGELLALRAREAGFDVTLDEYPGGHTVANKVTELVGYLKDAASQ